MLVTPNINRSKSLGIASEIPMCGIIITNILNFNLLIEDEIENDYYFEDRFNEIDDGTPESDNEIFCSYGVCDTVEQVIEKYKPWLIDSTTKFCVTFYTIKKSEQESEGGWRWHKWGPYIGTQTPTAEYIYDEPVIEEVMLFHIYQLK